LDLRKLQREIVIVLWNRSGGVIVLAVCHKKGPLSGALKRYFLEPSPQAAASEAMAETAT
jgi:hypothetical protein